MINKIKNLSIKILRKSEKYTKTDMVYLAKGGFWLTLGQIIAATSSFFLAIAFANWLPKETYGTYKYILSVVGILTIPTLSGMGTSLVRSIARNYDGSIFPAIFARIKWGLLGSIASLFVSTYYYLNNNPKLALSFVITAIFIPLMDSFTLFDFFLQGKKQFKTSTKYNLLIKTIAFFITLVILYISNNLFIILFTYFFTYTALRFIFLKITINKYVKNKEKDPQIISFGKHLSLMNIISTLANQVDKIILFQYVGAIELAVYSFAVAIPEQIRGFLKNTGSLALPKFSDHAENIKINSVFKHSLKLLLVLIIIIIIYIPLAPYIYNLFFPQYSSSIIYSQIFAISLIATSAVLPKAALQAKKENKKLYVFNIVTSIFQLIITLTGAFFFGLLGIVWARVVSRIFNLIFIWIIIFYNNKNHSMS